MSPISRTAVLDVEQRLLRLRRGEQDAEVRAARRRYLEQQDLFECSEKHGDALTKKALLLAQAKATLVLPDSTPLLDINVAMENVPIDANISMHIERKLACVQAIPGITELSGLPTPADAEHAQLDLIRAHVQYIAELTNEATLLCSLCALERSSPIYETAQALESYFGGLIHSLSLKLRIIAADMFNELYSAETVQALESLRGLLKTEEARLLKEQAVLDEQLAIYREAGEEFQEIAQSYAQVVQETQAVRRDMADLQNL